MVHVHTYQFFLNFIVFSNKINFEKIYKKCMGGSKKHHTLSVCWLSSKFLYQVNNPSYLIFNQIEFIHKPDLSFKFSFFRSGLKLATRSLALLVYTSTSLESSSPQSRWSGHQKKSTKTPSSNVDSWLIVITYSFLIFVKCTNN